MSPPFPFRVIFIIGSAMHDGMVVEELNVTWLQRHIEIDTRPCRNFSDEPHGIGLDIRQLYVRALHCPING
jgi:hypothetical protein